MNISQRASVSSRFIPKVRKASEIISSLLEYFSASVSIFEICLKDTKKRAKYLLWGKYSLRIYSKVTKFKGTLLLILDNFFDYTTPLVGFEVLVPLVLLCNLLLSCSFFLGNFFVLFHSPFRHDSFCHPSLIV